MAVGVSSLALVPRVREGGGGRTERRFLDFVIDGVSLFDLLTQTGHDVVSPLGWGLDEAATRRRLRLEEPPSLGDAREPVMVCAECGDLGCGALTVQITEAQVLVSWARSAWQDDRDDPHLGAQECASIGPFHFERTGYLAALAPESAA